MCGHDTRAGAFPVNGDVIDLDLPIACGQKLSLRASELKQESQNDWLKT